MRRAEQRKFETHWDVIARRGGMRVEPAFILESVLSLFSEAMHYQQSGETSEAVALYDRSSRLSRISPKFIATACRSRQLRQAR